ncbi:MAG: hypothetical protein HY706_22190 [Candidatus Hydrogenedentes bacterium]|nr:hypothetical protein [Candidatus Hydrogenedentota bacterium]
MTSRERIEAALKHQEPDRTPIFEYVLLPPLAEAFLGRRYVDYAGEGDWSELVREKGWENAIRQYAVDRVALATRLGHDMLYVVFNPLPPKTRDPRRKRERVAPTDPVERIIFENEEAAEQLVYEPPEDVMLIYDLLKEEMARRDLDLPILAPCYYHGVWTNTDLMITMLAAPEVAHRHFALATQKGLRFIEAYLRHGIDQIGVGGDFAGNRPLISPEMYREFMAPEIRNLTRRIHSAGKRAINASDGDLWPVIEDFLLGCEVDGYLEIDMGAGMDLHRLKAAYGDHITFYGNMDCGNILSFCTPEEVRRYTRECLEAGLGNGGHVFCCSNAITASVRPDNYLAMLRAYRKMFGLPNLPAL